MQQSRKNRSCSQSFLRRNVQRINIFRLKHIWQNNVFTILKYLELIPSMEVYDTTFRLLKQETVDGRHIYETLSFFLRKRGSDSTGKRIEMLASYETYNLYVKKRWEKIYKEAGNRGCFLGNSIASDHCFFKSCLECNVQR